MYFDDSLLNRSVTHWVYGEGKIVAVLGNSVKVQFASTQKEYGETAFASSFIQFTEDKERKQQEQKRREQERKSYLIYFERKGLSQAVIQRIKEYIPLEEIRHRIITIDYFDALYPYLDLDYNTYIFLSVEELNDYVKKHVKK